MAQPGRVGPVGGVVEALLDTVQEAAAAVAAVAEAMTGAVEARVLAVAMGKGR